MTTKTGARTHNAAVKRRVDTFNLAARSARPLEQLVIQMERPTPFEKATGEIDRAYRDEYTRTGEEPQGIVISPDIYLSMPIGRDAGDMRWKGLPILVDGLLEGFTARAYSDPAEWMMAAGAV